MKASSLFSSINQEDFKRCFRLEEDPLQWLCRLKEVCQEHEQIWAKSSKSDIPPGCYIGEHVYIHPTVKLPPVCVIMGPCYIGEGTEIRPFAYIREHVIIGKHCVIGNSCELKHSLLLDHVQVPHFNYVGDSILGNYVHLGAGAICSNLRLDQQPVKIHFQEERRDTGLRKLGAILGDHVEVACNVVLNPGTVLEPNTLVYPDHSLHVKK